MLHLFYVFFRLGCFSFGGPVAHTGYFYREFVELRQWLTAEEFGRYVALCHSLPGPASSQLGMAIGHHQTGALGSVIAFIAYTLPSALLMIIAGLGYSHLSELSWLAGVLAGLKLFAVVVVFHALMGMFANLCTDNIRKVIALIAFCAFIVLPSLWTQIFILTFAGILGVWLFQQPVKYQLVPSKTGVKGGIYLILFAGLLLGLPVLVATKPDLSLLALFDAFYRTGALVFGGGHVVLPMLQTQAVVAQLETETFIAGYSLAQALPGPMFTLSGFLGTQIQQTWLGGVVALIAIFLPGWLLLMAILPRWQQWQQQPKISAGLAGVSAATVGLLMSAFYDPIWSSAIHDRWDLVLVIFGVIGLHLYKLPIGLLLIFFVATGTIL